MKKKMFPIFVLCILSATSIFARKVRVFPDLLVVSEIKVDGDQIFINEGKSIGIYSLKDFSLQTKFGRKGEGPQEFKVFPTEKIRMHVRADSIVVNSIGKISFFTREGRFIREEKIYANHGFEGYIPIGNKFVSYGFHRGNKEFFSLYTIDLYNSHHKKVKEINRYKIVFRPARRINPFDSVKPLFQVYKSRIYVLGVTGVIDIFSGDGVKLYAVDTKLKKIKITGDFIKKFHDWVRNHPMFKKRYEAIKNLIEFPGYFPAVREFFISDEKIYLETYKRENGKSEFYVFDIQGHSLGHMMLPHAFINVIESYPGTIHKGNFYQLIENEDDEVWELHITGIR